MSYNLDDQLTVMSYADGTHDVRFTYNPDGSSIVRGDGTATTSLFFDNLNRLTATVMTAPPPNGVFPTRAAAPTCPAGASSTIVCYAYDAASNLTSVATAEGVTSYSYNKTNRMDAIDEPGGVLDLFGYNHDGKRVDSWLDATGTNATFPPAYDATNTIKAPTGFAAHLHSQLGNDNQLTELVTTRNSSDSTKVADITYDYTDPLGDKTDERYSASDSVPGTTANYAFNGLDRLTGVTGSTSATFGYDANGDVSNYNGTTQHFNSADQQTDSPYLYDGAGNLTTAPAGAITYNGGDQMTSVTPTGGTAATFTYTGLGQSELTQSSQTTFQNSIVGPVASTFNSGTSYYTRDPQGELVSLRTQTGAEYFPAFDGVGSVTTLVDTTGAVATTWTYNAYGKITGSSGSTGATRFRFAGGWQDGTTGYYHFGDRWYDPATGHWSQEDPVSHLGDLTQGNQYAYAGDNPVNYTDPSGRSLFDEIDSFVEGAVDALAGGIGLAELAAGSGIFAEVEGIAAVAAGVTFGGLLVVGLGFLAIGSLEVAGVL
jgi:RHS repeat-associated protein